MATHLLSQEYNLVSTDKAVFIWAALSLYWLQLAQQIPHNSRQEGIDNLHYCPVCGSALLRVWYISVHRKVYVIYTAVSVKASGIWFVPNAQTAMNTKILKCGH